MKLFPLILLNVVLPLVGAYLVSPPGAVGPDTTSDCSGWVAYSFDSTCASIEAFLGLLKTNSRHGCTLISGLYYCIQINFDTVSLASTSTTTTSTSTSITTTITSTTSGDGVSTPTPYQTGMASNCNKFYLVVSGDECGTIATNEGISLAEFYAWNPAVGSSCAYLDLGDYVCVGIIGGTSTTTTTTPTSPGNGITTPTPYQTGMNTNCDKFYLVSSGDECGTIATYEGISLADFYTWNPAVGSTCQYLDLGDYVCVGLEPCTSASVLAAPSQDASTCGSPGFSHDSTSLLIISYTAGSPYVESAAACGAQCLATSSCTNLYFTEGSYCNLHQGASTFAESTASGYYMWYEASCFSSGEACGSFGFSNDNPTTLLISYTSGSPYVASAAACEAQCLSTPSCTNVYFTEGSYCNLHSPSTFLASTASGYYTWYQSGCFECTSYTS